MSEFIYSIATENVAPWRKDSRMAVDWMKKQEGLYGVYQNYPYRMLWFFDTLNNAKKARNLGKAQGIQFGTYICKFKVCADGVPEFVETI